MPDASPHPQSPAVDAVVTLSNGIKMPKIGLGVWRAGSDRETERVVRTAIDHGYRSVDTAMIYGNERGVGRALRECGLKREELFVTTKAWNDDVRADRIPAAFEQSLSRLGADYVDLYLVHWPIAGKIVRAWRAMEQLLASGRVRAIGVSNHLRPHLSELLAAAEIVPMVNQIELHPYLQSRDLVDFCRSKGIQIEAWSPLMQGGDLLADPTIRKIAEAHGKSPAQVILRWDIQKGVVAIPKSVTPRRIAENIAIFDFSLNDSEMAAIDALERNHRAGPDPLHFSF